MRRRDPEARRAEILDAAADLIVEVGVERLTHRLVAERAQVPLGSTTQHFSSIDDLRARALEKLATEIDDDLEQVRQDLDGTDLTAEGLVDRFTEYLSDRRRLVTDIALMSAGAYDPALRELALHWQHSFIDLMKTRMPEANAYALALLSDGLTVYTALHEEPMPRDLMLALVTPFVPLPSPKDSDS